MDGVNVETNLVSKDRKPVLTFRDPVRDVFGWMNVNSGRFIDRDQVFIFVKDPK